MTNQAQALADALLPCPFCGKRPLIEDGRNDRPWVVQCYNRDCRVQPFIDDGDTKADAIAAWNGIHRIQAEKRNNALAVELREVTQADRAMKGKSAVVRFDLIDRILRALGGEG